VARRLKLKQVAVVDESGTVYLTSAMKERILFATDIDPVVIREN